MQEIIKIIGAAFVTAITATLLKSNRPELSFAVVITGSIVILLFILDALRGSLGVLSEIAAMTGMESGIIKVLLKIVGIGYLTEFSVGTLNDFSASSIADKVSLAGKVTIIMMSLPILNALLTLFKQFLTLL